MYLNLDDRKCTSTSLPSLNHKTNLLILLAQKEPPYHGVMSFFRSGFGYRSCPCNCGFFLYLKGFRKGKRLSLTMVLNLCWAFCNTVLRHFNSLPLHSKHFIALFTIVKIWKEPRCPLVDEWIKSCATFPPRNTMQL